MRENLSRRVITRNTRRDSLAAIAFGKNHRRVSNTCDLRCRLYFARLDARIVLARDHLHSGVALFRPKTHWMVGKDLFIFFLLSHTFGLKTNSFRREDLFFLSLPIFWPIKGATILSDASALTRGWFQRLERPRAKSHSCKQQIVCNLQVAQA